MWYAGQLGGDCSLGIKGNSPSMTPSVACPDRRGWSSILMPSNMMHVSHCFPTERSSSDTRPVAISIKIQSDWARKEKSCRNIKENVKSSVWHSSFSTVEEKKNLKWKKYSESGELQCKQRLPQSPQCQWQISIIKGGKLSQQSPVTIRVQRKLHVHDPTGEFSSLRNSLGKGGG